MKTPQTTRCKKPSKKPSGHRKTLLASRQRLSRVIKMATSTARLSEVEVRSSGNTLVYLDLQFGQMKAGRVIIELFDKVAPKATENFRALCTGEKGGRLHYKGLRFHKVISFCMVQSGDVVCNNGTSGESIYGEPFEDDDLTTYHHGEAGMVGMCNSGPNSNQSQFYITTVPCLHLDGTNQIVGRVIRGLDTVVAMSDVNRTNDIPDKDITIVNCGELKPDEPWGCEENDGTQDVYPEWPNDWDSSDLEDKMAIAIDNIKESGNLYFHKNNLLEAERKYLKALHYIEKYQKLPGCKHDKADKLFIASNLNLAEVMLRNENFKSVVAICDEVLAKQKHAKAYYRRGLAFSGLKDYDKALNDLTKATSLQPTDTQIKAVLERVKNKKMRYYRAEQKVYAHMFD